MAGKQAEGQKVSGDGGSHWGEVSPCPYMGRAEPRPQLMAALGVRGPGLPCGTSTAPVTCLYPAPQRRQRISGHGAKGIRSLLSLAA